jgi:hypothetical protein
VSPMKARPRSSSCIGSSSLSHASIEPTNLEEAVNFDKIFMEVSALGLVHHLHPFLNYISYCSPLIFAFLPTIPLLTCNSTATGERTALCLAKQTN